jgi:hypothetical protein
LDKLLWLKLIKWIFKIKQTHLQYLQLFLWRHTRNPLVQWRQKSKQSSNAGAETAAEQGPEGGADIRVQRLALRRGQNLVWQNVFVKLTANSRTRQITWTVAVNPVLSSRWVFILDFSEYIFFYYIVVLFNFRNPTSIYIHFIKEWR